MKKKTDVKWAGLSSRKNYQRRQEAEGRRQEENCPTLLS
jgi:hypothetical protein